MSTTYKIYQIPPTYNYTGVALVSATSAANANKLIKEFKEYDLHDYEDSSGYEYVGEHNVVKGLSADHEGLLLKEIRFSYSP